MALLTDLLEPRGGGTELEFNDVPYTHLILKADVRLKDLSIPRGGGTEQEFIPYTHLILKGGLRLKDLSNTTVNVYVMTFLHFWTTVVFIFRRPFSFLTIIVRIFSTVV